MVSFATNSKTVGIVPGTSLLIHFTSPLLQVARLKLKEIDGRAPPGTKKD